MKIVHIAPNAPYNDHWGYQENLLPKYQRKLGHELCLIITNTTHKNGEVEQVPCADYVLEDGVRVIRLARKQYRSRKLTAYRAKMDVLPYLNEIKPDFIFFHGLVSESIFDCIKYKRNNSDCVIVQDNHLDYNIGMTVHTFKQKVARAYYRAVNRRSIPYVSRVYGVTPWRKTYAEDYFRIPSSKTDVLIMGADDEKIDFAHRDEIRSRIRSEYNIADDEFLLVSGGKIDKQKRIHLLMEAVMQMPNTRLLIFGKVGDDIKDTFDSLLSQSNNIIYIGWIASEDAYDYFFAADLVVFPGQHSVLWEQACASKVPCLFGRWDGMEHVNNGGNADFLDSHRPEDIAKQITDLHFTDRYVRMRHIALSDKTDIYLYSNIARKSLEQANK